MAKKDDISDQTVIVLAILVVFLSLLGSGILLYELSIKSESDGVVKKYYFEDDDFYDLNKTKESSSTGIISLNIVAE